MVVDPPDTVEALFLKNKLTPPAKSDSVPKKDVIDAANELFSHICKGWADLSDIEKVRFSFLHLKNQVQIAMQKVNVEESQRDEYVATVFYQAINGNSDHVVGRRFNAFLRKGGDATPQEGDEIGPDHLQSFLLKHEEWRDHEAAPTIFNNPNAANQAASYNAMFRFQDAESTVCYLSAVADAIFYNMRNQFGDSHDDAVAAYCLNINRYMRNKFSDEEVFDYIFQGAGGHPEETLKAMLSSHNPSKTLVGHAEFDMADTDGGEDLRLLFNYVKSRLFTNGALILEYFKPFDDFLDKSNGQLEFSGNWNELTRTQSPTPFIQLDRPCMMSHALLVVGARLTQSKEKMGGLAFLVQNSFIDKPFAVVGLDLLRSMDVERLLYVKNGLHFETDDDSSLPHSPRFTVSGSNSEDNGRQSFSPVKKEWEGDEDDKYSFKLNPGYYFHKIDPTKQHTFYS